MICLTFTFSFSTHREKSRVAWPCFGRKFVCSTSPSALQPTRNPRTRFGFIVRLYGDTSTGRRCFLFYLLRGLPHCLCLTHSYLATWTMSTNNDPALGVPSNLLLERLKQSVFTVAHAVCERTVHHRATTLGQLAALALVAVNLLQMLALPIVAQFGYGPDAVSVGQIISMKSFILGSSWAHFAWGYSLVVVLAWSLLGGLFYLHSTLANGPLTRTWPMVVVRLLITLLVQAGFVPVVHVLLTPFSCTEMKLVHINEMQCHDGAHVLVLITSVVTCVPFVAASLAIKLLVHESDPNAVDVMSMVR